MSDRKEVDLEGKGGGEDLGGVEEGEITVRVCMLFEEGSVFKKKGKIVCYE